MKHGQWHPFMLISGHVLLFFGAHLYVCEGDSFLLPRDSETRN